MVKMNGQYLTATCDKSGYMKYSYTFLSGNKIETGIVSGFEKLDENETPYVKQNNLKSSIGSWGFGLPPGSSMEFSVHIPLSLMDNVNTDIKLRGKGADKN